MQQADNPFRKNSFLHQKATAACLTCDALSGMRNYDTFQRFWEEVRNKAEEVDIGEPGLLRTSKIPTRFEVGEGEGYHATTPE